MNSLFIFHDIHSNMYKHIHVKIFRKKRFVSFLYIATICSYLNSCYRLEIHKSF